MKSTLPALLIAVVFYVGLFHAVESSAQQPGAGSGNRSGSVPQGGVLRSGPLPDLNAFTADGQPLKLRALCQGSYTVLSSGCLTCPEFRRSYPEIEAASADYSPKGVNFYYFYKSLRHPELDGYVQAQNMGERLLQLAEARKLYGTKVSWIADTIDDSLRIGLRAEAEPELLRTGTGRLFLGFYPDPILKAHWNNLTPPMKYVLQLPPGVMATPAEVSAAKGPGDSDAEPRQFWVNIKSDKTPGDIKLALHYYGCTPDICQALTHEYTIHFAPENRGANTYGFNRGPGGSGGEKAKGGGKKGGPGGQSSGNPRSN